MDILSWGPVAPSLSLRLDDLRTQGDPLLDEPLAARGLAAARQWQAALATPHAADLPFSLSLPGWAEPQRLARACATFQIHAVPLAMLLGSASLLECFACAEGARALYAARTLPRDPERRVGRTGRFVLDVLAPSAWQDGTAARTLARVRVLHAVTRHRLLHTPLACPATSPVPLCQEDQLGTLLAFGLSPLLRLRAQGVPLSTHTVEDMLHLWRVAGHLLGVQVAHLPATEAEARMLGATIRARSFAPSPEGRALAAGVLDTYARVTGSPLLHRAFLRWLRAVLGESTCDVLGIAGRPAGHTGHLLARSGGSASQAWQALQSLPGAAHLRTAALAALRQHAEGMAAGAPEPLAQECAA